MQILETGFNNLKPKKIQTIKLKSIASNIRFRVLYSGKILINNKALKITNAKRTRKSNTLLNILLWHNFININVLKTNHSKKEARFKLALGEVEILMFRSSEH